MEEEWEVGRGAVDSGPNSRGHRASLGWAYFKVGRLEEAEQYLAGAAKESTHPVIHEHLGDVYDKRGKKEMALAEWQKAIAEMQKGPGDLGDSAQLARLKSKISAAGH